MKHTFVASTRDHSERRQDGSLVGFCSTVLQVGKNQHSALNGPVAHLVERLHGMEEVARSIRVRSTSRFAPKSCKPST